jgi:NAD(P) transhydrogenase subunit alpha
MIVGVPKETFPGERRVALVPGMVQNLKRAGLEVLVERGAGAEAGFPDAQYEEKGATLASREDVFGTAQVILQVRAPGANPERGADDVALLKAGQTVIGFCDPLTSPDATRALAGAGVTLFSMELMPRITRAQSMDALSSMATIAGYKAVLMAAERLNRFFPMLMTAAGTVAPARVLVLGAGVAGLMACATAKRLGANVEATDVRPVVKEQVQSVGARFLEVESDESGEGEGGYAREMSEDYKRRQAELVGRHIVKADVVIPTALIPGRRAPVLITADQVKRMRPGSVIVDLAAEMGGNCELTRPDEEIVEHGVTIIGHTNLPSTMAFHASQMFSRNVENFVLHVCGEDGFRFDADDEITAGALITRDGEVVHARTRETLDSKGE